MDSDIKTVVTLPEVPAFGKEDDLKVGWDTIA
jgi:hypothetical protein